MGRRTAAVALLSLALGAQLGHAAGPEPSGLSTAPENRHLKTYGRTLPPLGFVKFCGRFPSSCRKAQQVTLRPHITAERWNQLYRTNALVNGRVAPVSDQELYGEAEYWAYPTDAGDCEDYVLLKLRYLERIGFPRSALLITVVLDEKKEGHAVLTVITDEGDFILDNRNNRIVSWQDTDYTYLKRQSQHDPRQWLSLLRGPAAGPRVALAASPP